MRNGFAGLDACVHCGFCLQACPTFLVTGDEADSPRGRIELIRALERGELAPSDPDLQLHLDRCLGCRGCEPVCPSGVQYGHGLEAARALLAHTTRVPWLARAALRTLTTPGISKIVYWLARLLRRTGLPRRLAGWGRLRFAMGMLAATQPDARTAGRPDARTAAANDTAAKWRRGGGKRRSPPSISPPPHAPPSAALLFRGCVMQGLFAHVHEATIRTLATNGYAVGEVAGQVCCGALHAHAGLLDHARALAHRNVAAFGEGDEPIVVNSAGCGAWMKEYGRLDDGGERFAARVRDVTELLAAGGDPVAGAPLDLHVAYDPPCHLLHAQRVAGPPARLFAAIPLLELVDVAGAAECCGSAGLYTLLQPQFSRAVLRAKLGHLREAAPEIVATGNPGCLMQIGAGLLAAGVPATVAHPVELLDAAYAAAGHYE
ncbi:MAG: (Fe-S)-binding protein [Gemmatimonadales bacterium]